MNICHPAWFSNVHSRSNETTIESHAVPEFSILVVEDDAMLSLAMEDILQKLGYTNLEFAFDLASALEIADSRSFSLAFLNIDLDGELSLPVARVLRANNIPWFFYHRFRIALRF